MAFPRLLPEPCRAWGSPALESTSSDGVGIVAPRESLSVPNTTTVPRIEINRRFSGHPGGLAS
jgi:hypothetical protein